ncbi:MAG: serine/threonine protein kinase [Myxococcales bacterium]|nr:serine/threonine protein kinase [Myxococcales bacterium]
MQQATPKQDAEPGALHEGGWASFRGKTLGRYTVVEHLDSGGMAEIFLAVNEGASEGASPVRSGGAGFRKALVLKLLQSRYHDNAQVVEMFKDEARIGARLHHPSIVDIYDFATAEGQHFIAMEHIEGRILTQLIRRGLEVGQPLPLGLAAYICAQVAEGLAYMYEGRDRSGQPLSVVHRDISPTNIIISDRGHTKIIDFGIATDHGDRKEDHEGTARQVLVHVTRAGAGTAARRSFRHLLFGHHPLRDHARPAALPGQAPGHHEAHRGGADPASHLPGPRLSPGARKDRHESPREASPGPLRLGRGDGTRPRCLFGVAARADRRATGGHLLAGDRGAQRRHLGPRPASRRRVRGRGRRLRRRRARLRPGQRRRVAGGSRRDGPAGTFTPTPAARAQGRTGRVRSGRGRAVRASGRARLDGSRGGAAGGPGWGGGSQARTCPCGGGTKGSDILPLPRGANAARPGAGGGRCRLDVREVRGCRRKNEPFSGSTSLGRGRRS